MESGHVTTPFGRRSVSLGMLASQMMARKIKPGVSVNKWRLYRSLCEARSSLGINDRALSVLNALLSFYPHDELSEDNGLIVFPSNTQLSLRAHGMAEQTIRRHIAALIEAGLLLRKDSANGKRFARRGRGGNICDAFGFSFAPLLARALEIERLAQDVADARLNLQRLREQLTVCRRDITKLIETAIEEDMAGDWQAMTEMLKSALARLPRPASARQLEELYNELSAFRDEIFNALETQLKIEKVSGNVSQNERHIQNSQSESFSELEDGTETALEKPSSLAIAPDVEAKLASGPLAAVGMVLTRTSQVAGLRSLSLGLVLRACPQIADYSSAGIVSGWRDLMAAADVVRTMLGVSPSAYQDACAAMGPEHAAVIIACILERGDQINSAGGYLRDLTRKAERGEFSLSPMLMALVRAKSQPQQGAA
ncbi:replication initiation protein RepC [Rhizobium sp. XQZ8]|uniref:plasmid replication protein RepC n=1 Tax=Rhizobium populisoli TaxID=2859785 RepID=UPI001CA52746|nr:plasmid replication protein RepC [Rhizobium populisoli]MBW6425456.1 replication initiation protein RepC [Rhizobium populisoli]